MTQSVMIWNHTEPSAWTDPAVIAQLIVAIIALFAPITVYLLDRKIRRRKKTQQEHTMEAAIDAELHYLVAFYEEVWGFWNETGRYADHMVLTFSIQLPPLLSTPQIWTATLTPEKQKKLSELISDVHHYNQIIRELHAVNSSPSKLRNQSRATRKFNKLECHLKGFGFTLNPWLQGEPDPTL